MSRLARSALPRSPPLLFYNVFMVNEEAKWQYTTSNSLTQWYGHVQLLEDKALGQWFCADLQTGELLWDRHLRRPNTICGVSENVIVASEMRSDGPWTLTFGCYGISLATGELLWTAHRNRGGKFLRLMDFIPGFTNELRDKPVAVQGSECLCEKGSVIDVNTGRFLRKVSPSDHFTKTNGDQSASWILYSKRRVMLENGELLAHSPDRNCPREQRTSKGFHLARLRSDDEQLWHFHLEKENHFIEGNYFSYRHHGDYMFLLVSDRPAYVPIDPEKPNCVKPNPRRNFLWVLDLQTGNICQKIALSEETQEECRIEDVNDQFLLIRREAKTLLCFARR